MIQHSEKPGHYLFANLAAFSITGGMEKFNRSFLHALYNLEQKGVLTADAVSLCDTGADEAYFPNTKYHGYGLNRLKFVWNLVTSAKKYDTIILGHVNLSLPGLLIKYIYGRQKRVILITHGIEVWRELSMPARWFLKKANGILAVSHFTKDKLISVHGVDAGNIQVFTNTFDPYFVFPTDFSKPAFLQERYGIGAGQKLLFTLTRLSSTEKFKGYDQVIAALPELKKRYPDIRYMIAGKYDEQEKARLVSLITKHKLEDTILLPGFIADDEVTAHYLLADVFIMPSKKEGFGIVFIEAMACGLPVIAGNRDGSVDALKNGELGTLVDPDSTQEISNGLIHNLSSHSLSTAAERLKLQQKVMETFGFDIYCKNLQIVLGHI